MRIGLRGLPRFLTCDCLHFMRVDTRAQELLLLQLCRQASCLCRRHGCIETAVLALPDLVHVLLVLLVL